MFNSYHKMFAKFLEVVTATLVIALVAVAILPWLPVRYSGVSPAFGGGFPVDDFYVTCSPGSQDITQGDTGTVNASTTDNPPASSFYLPFIHSAKASFTEPVTWSVNDLTSVADAPTITFTDNDQVPDATTIVNIITTSETTVGAYTLVLDATAASVTHTCSIDFNVVAPVADPDYSVSCSSASPATVTAGDSSTATLSTTGVNGFATAITWSNSAINPSMTNPPVFNFTNNDQVPDADTALEIVTDSSTDVGTFTFTMEANDGVTPKTCDVELIINAASSITYPPTFTGGGGSGSSVPPVSVTPPASTTSPTATTNPSSASVSCTDQMATDSLKPLYRLWNPRFTDHFYTTDSVERSAALKAGYTPEGVVGSLYPTQVSGAVPLYRLWNAKLTAHFYTFDDSERDTAVRNGYRYDGVQGYGFRDMVAGANPFYRMLNSEQFDHFYTFSEGEIAFATDLGYKLEGITGYICGGSQVGPDTVVLYRMFSSREQKHFYTESVVEREDLEKLGYKTESTLGYVFVGPQPEAVPVYRLYSSKDLNHYYTTKLEERDAAVARGYKFEKISGYVYAGSHDGTTPIYAIANPRGNKNLYTTSLDERDSLVRRGYVDLGILGFIKTSE